MIESTGSDRVDEIVRFDAEAFASGHFDVGLFRVLTTDFDAGVWLLSAKYFTGTSTFASGKYVAAQRRGMLYGTIMKWRATRSSPSKWLIKATACPSWNPAR